MGKAGVLAIGAVFAPEITYWAYSAYYVGTSDNPQQAFTEVLQGAAGD
jgi:hypothetical protein